MSQRIEPRILKGFRDTLPPTAILRNKMITTMQEVFSTFGFVPIDTPALEYAEILLGKGSDETDKQMYRFADGGQRDVALRFDLTIPFARFAAMHINELGTPFKRFHIAPVWRAEKPQRGRYREFIQCDVDIIGTTSAVADAEIVGIINQTLNKLDIKHEIRLNNRKLLNGVLENLSALEKSTAVLRAIDKLDKLGKDIVAEELQRETNLNNSQVTELFSFLEISQSHSSFGETLKSLRSLLKSSELGLKGLSELELVYNCVCESSIDENTLSLDVSIARGLDYYTGTIFETRFSEVPEIGSICSGGRYDNLASLYTKQHLPGVGASFGLDRILAGLEELKRISSKSSTADVLVSCLEDSAIPTSFAIADLLRNSGLAVELYSTAAKLGAQIKYANRKEIPIAVIIGEKEKLNKTCSIKDLRSGEQKDDIAFSNAPETIRKMLNN